MDIITSDYNGSIDNVITSVMNSRVDLLLPELEFVDSYRTDDGVYFYVLEVFNIVKQQKEEYTGEINIFISNSSSSNEQ